MREKQVQMKLLGYGYGDTDEECERDAERWLRATLDGLRVTVRSTSYSDIEANVIPEDGETEDQRIRSACLKAIRDIEAAQGHIPCRYWDSRASLSQALTGLRSAVGRPANLAAAPAKAAPCECARLRTVNAAVLTTWNRARQHLLTRSDPTEAIRYMDRAILASTEEQETPDADKR